MSDAQNTVYKDGDCSLCRDTGYIPALRKQKRGDYLPPHKVLQDSLSEL